MTLNVNSPRSVNVDMAIIQVSQFAIGTDDGYSFQLLLLRSSVSIQRRQLSL